MIYSVYADNICIYSSGSDGPGIQLIEPKLTLEGNCAGSFEFTMPPGNNGYSSIERLSTTLTVMEDGTEIWEGRVLSDSIDFWNNRKAFAEGSLAYLNDSIQPMAEYHDISPRNFLAALLNNHNAQVAENRRIYIGTVTVTDPNDSLYRYTNYESTMQCITEKLVERLGGHLQIRKINGVRYLDYLADYPHTNSQVISFGYNLIDFTRNWDATDYATVVLPLGKALDESPIETLTAYLTVESVNSGSPYVQNSTAVTNYGWVCKVEHWDDVSEPSNLLRKAQAFLADQQFDAVAIEMSAADLHGMSIDTEAFRLLDLVRCVSPPHGMDRYFPITKMEVMLDAPESTVITLGGVSSESLTARTTKASVNISSKMGEAPHVDKSVLDEMEATAQELIDESIATIGGWDNSSGDLHTDLSVGPNLYRYILNSPTTNAQMLAGVQKYDSSTSSWKSQYGLFADGGATLSTIRFGNSVDFASNHYPTMQGVHNIIVLHPASDPNNNTPNLELGDPSGTNSWCLSPGTDAGLNLGRNGRRWNDIYAVNGTIQTSDLNDKYDIRDLGNRAEQLIMGLKPVSFKMKDGTSGRDHLGFIAQDVEQLILDMGLTTKEFGGIVKSKNEDGSETYGLRYEEFIAPLVQAVQNLRNEVDNLLKHIG